MLSSLLEKADLVLLNFKKMIFPFTDPDHDPIEVLLYRGKSSHVQTVMVDGKIVVENGTLLTLDEEAMRKRLIEAASRPRTEGEKALARALEELRMQVVGYYRGWPQKVKSIPYYTIHSREEGLK